MFYPDEIVISSTCWESMIAGFVEGELISLDVYRKYGIVPESIYVGKILKSYDTPDGEKAYFVDLGGGNTGFWKNRKNMKMISSSGLTDKIFEGQKALFQIASIPDNDKNVVLDSEIKLAGNYLVFIPWGSKLKVSSSLSPEDADYLSSSLSFLLDYDYGWIVRSEAKNARLDEITAESNKLKDIWKNIEAKFASLERLGEIYKKEISFKDVCGKKSNIKKIVTDDSDACVIFKQLYPDNMIVRKDETASIWAEYALDEEIENLLSDEISLIGGGSVYIEKTRAFTAIDVDGSNVIDIKKLNFVAAKEIARQIKLRNICGKVVIDFAGSGKVATDSEIIKIMQDRLGKNRVLGFSKAGNLELILPRNGMLLNNLLADDYIPAIIAKKIRDVVIEAKTSKVAIQKLSLSKDCLDWLQNNQIDIKLEIMSSHAIDVEINKE